MLITFISYTNLIYTIQYIYFRVSFRILKLYILLKQLHAMENGCEKMTNEKNQKNGTLVRRHCCLRNYELGFSHEYFLSKLGGN